MCWLGTFVVRCVQYDGRLVVSGVYDYMVKIWDPGREECLNDVANKVRKLGRRAKPKVVHLNLLAPYQGRWMSKTDTLKEGLVL